MKYLTILTLPLVIMFSSCIEEVMVIEEDPTDEVTLSAAFDEFDKDNTSIYVDGSDIVIETNGIPNHTTPYWGAGDDLYVEPQDGFQATPSLIRSVSATLRAPANPMKASSSSSTSLGAIGISISGAAIYNDQEGNGPLSGAAVSLDYSGGHIGPGAYHYHTEPEAWSKDDDKLIGIMADGFFIYGRKCNATGTYPADTDASGGHSSVTQHSDIASYHYHIQNELYINKYYLIFGGDFQGTPSSIR